MTQVARTHLVCIGLLALTTAIPIPQAAGQEAERENSELAYRLIYAPIDTIAQLARGELRTMQRERFEFLIRALARQAPLNESKGVHLNRATYRARLRDRTLVDGSARFEIVLTNDPAEMQLAPLNLAIASPRWLSSDEPARLGSTPTGDHALQVPSSGTLEFSWTLEAKRQTDSDDLEFELQLPRAPINRLELILPDGLVVVSNHGIAVRQPSSEENADGIGAGNTLWRLELGGSSNVILRLRETAVGRPQARVRQVNSYTISERGIEVKADLRLNCEREPLTHLEFQIDEGLQVIRARSGQEPLTWTTVANRDGQSSSVTIAFDPPLDGLNRIVTLRAVSLAQAADLTRLPRIRPLGVNWQQESAHITVEPPLLVRDLVLTSAVQVPAVDRRAAAEADSLSLEFIQPDAQVELRLANRAPRYSYSAGTTVDVSAGELMATTRLRLRGQTPNLFEVEVPVHTNWTIESVESEQSDWIHDWKVRSADAFSTLVINFRQPISESAESICAIRARRGRATDTTPLHAANLLPIGALTGGEAIRQFLVIHPVEQQIAHYRQDRRVTWLTLDDLDAQETMLLEARETDPIVLLDGQEDELLIEVKAVPQAEFPFAANVRVLNRVTTRFVQERIRVEIDRSTPPSSKLKVQLSQTRTQPLRWTPENDPQRVLPATRVVTAETGVEVWTVDWPDPSSSSIVVVGERHFAPQDEMQLTLAHVDGASDQQGAVVIEASGDLELGVRHSPRLTAAPPFREGFRRQSPLRRVFRYDPTPDIVQEPASLSLAVLPEAEGQSRLCVWSATLNTHLDESGISRNRYTLQIENLGQSELSMVLGSNSVARQLYIDGQPSELAADRNRRLRIPLPAAQRFCVVQLDYEHVSDALGIWQKIPSSRPRINAPILSERWLVWTPPEFALGETSSRHESAWRACFRRLLGPALRPPDSAPFDLFSRQSWAALVDPSSRSDLHARTTAWIQRLGDPSFERWGEIVTDRSIAPSADSLEAPAPMLWLDEVRLSRRRITPERAIPAASGETDLERGLDRLRKARLALIETENATILTTADFLTQHGSQLTSTPLDVVMRMRDLRLDALKPTARVGESLELIRGSDWREKTGLWTDDADTLSPEPTGGWRLFVRTPDDSSNAQVVYHADMFLIISCLAFLITLAISWWIRSYWLRGSLALLVAATLAALLLPEPMSHAALGAFWGGLIGVLLTSRRPLPSVSESTATNPVVSTVSYHGIAIVIAATLAPVISIGQEPIGDDPPRRAGPIHPVYIPADENGEPQGNYVLVPPELHEVLTDRARVTSGSGSDWLLEAARYRTSILRANGSTSPRVESIQAAYQIHVTAVRASIQIPLPPDGAALLEREARLNGRPFRLRWNANRSAITLPIRDPGTYDLEVVYRLKQPTGTSINLPIVPTPRATLELTTPETIGPIVIESAHGAIETDEMASQIRADLGPTDRLSMRWASTESVDDPIVEQLSWLRIAPERVQLDIKLLVDASRWDSSVVRIEVDQRLRSTPESDEPIAITNAAEAGVQYLDYELVAPTDERASLDLSFVISDQTGIGGMRLPRFRVLGTDATPHELAVSVDSRLAIGPGSVAGADFQPVSSFTDKWGGDAKPDRAFKLRGRFSDWSCTTTLVTSPSQATIQVAYEIGQEDTLVLYLANLTGAGIRFRHTLDVPEHLEIERVVLIDGPTTRELRWSRVGRRELNVFFVEESSTSYQLGIVARQKSDGIGPRKLPRVTLLDSISSSQQLLVYRMSDVLLSSDVISITEPPLQIDPFIESRLGLSRFYSSITLVGEEDAPVIEVQPNERRLSADLTNIVSRREEGWYHELHVQYKVEKGILDAVRFEIPEVWLAGLRSELEAKVLFGKSPRPGQVRVTVWPKTPFDLTKPMTIAGLIPFSPGEPLRVPNVRLLEDGVITQRLYLPAEVDGQPVLWQATNLQREDFDPAQAPEAVQGENYLCYRIDEDRFDVTRLPSRRSSGRPVVQLCDVCVAWNDPQTYRGQALIDVLPGGLSECLIRCPAGVIPFAIAVEDTMVDVAPAEMHEGIRVELTSSELPQRIRVLFEGTVDATSVDGTKIKAPFIERVAAAPNTNSRAIEVVRTLWTIRAPSHAAVDMRIDGNAAPTAAEFELIRLNTLATILDLAAQMTTDFTRDDLSRWYQSWGSRFGAASRRVGTFQLAENRTELEERYAAVVEQLDVNDIHRQLASRNVADLIDAWNESAPHDGVTHLAAFEGARSSIRAEYRMAGEHDPLVRYLAASLIGLLGFGGIVSLGREQLETFRWLHLFGVLCGLSWWLWLQPSVVGWLIVVASLLSMRMLRWPAVRG